MSTKSNKIITFALTAIMALQLPTMAFADDEMNLDDAANFYATERSFNFDETSPSEAAIALLANNADENTWYFGNVAYTLQDGNKIVKFDFDTGEQEVLYEDSGIIDKMFLDPEMAYFMKGSSIYRLHFESQQVDEVFSDDALQDFYPVSNNKITIDVTNPGWTEYLAETGDTENEVGIAELLKFEVDLATGEKTQLNGWGAMEAELPAPMARISYGSYGSGKYFTKDGTACGTTVKCHTKGTCSWSNASADCNCKIYGSAIQCMGYAKYVYAQNHSSSSWGGAKSFTYQNSTAAQRTQAAKDMKKFVEGLGTASHIRINGSHSVIVTGTTSTGFNVIQANADNKNCKVTTGSYTYSTLVSNGTKISANV